MEVDLVKSLAPGVKVALPRRADDAVTLHVRMGHQGQESHGRGCRIAATPEQIILEMDSPLTARFALAHLNQYAR